MVRGGVVVCGMLTMKAKRRADGKTAPPLPLPTRRPTVARSRPWRSSCLRAELNPFTARSFLPLSVLTGGVVTGPNESPVSETSSMYSK